MRLRSQDLFPTILTEGGLLPPDLLQRIAAGDREVEGLRPEDYHLAEGERVNEAVTRAWNRLVGAWTGFRTILEKSPPGDPATTPTREKWLLILFQELGYGRLPIARAAELDGDSFPISHTWNAVPIHLVGARVDLDTKARGVAGAARSSPHGLVQSFLNRSQHHDWGFVSNGLRLRILRDSARLTRQAFVEFDLEAMMEGQAHSDFVVLWLLCHESRVEGERPSEFWLERWSKTAERQGTRALDALRDGVQRAIEFLGQGFLAHPGNRALRERLRSGGLPDQEFYRQLLRLAYRLLFLFVAEDRGLIHSPDASPTARARYERFYSTHRLRQMAGRLRGTKHSDLYRTLRVVAEKLDDDAGCKALGLYCLGGFLWSRGAVADLHSSELANLDFLDAIRALASTAQGRNLRAVDYKNLGSEELGSIYESLLELRPRLNLDTATVSLAVEGGHERKTTGSYYTPTSLIKCLLDSALAPVLAEAARSKNPEQAILALKVCDPACGSGHFLIAASHRIARQLAALRTGDEEASPAALKTALRDVIGHCIYGVDANPMAAELCKVSLWMEALEPGKPLSFLEHRIVVGNSLLGATPEAIARGIPDDAFQLLEGDDPYGVKAAKKRNREERKGRQQPLFIETAAEPRSLYETLSESVSRLATGNDATIAAIRDKEERLRRLAESPEYHRSHLVADAWCAAFVWRKTIDAPPVVTEGVFQKLRRNPTEVPAIVRQEVTRLGEVYRFFHWQLAFPDVFRIPEDGELANDTTGWAGGFDVVLGNPPWDRVKLQEKEWFADNGYEDIATARNSAIRKRLIAALQNEQPGVYARFVEAIRRADGESTLLKSSQLYPLATSGEVNTFAVFTELATKILSATGIVGLVIPTGLATDDRLKVFFSELVDRGRLISLIGFENEDFIFPGIANVIRFCAITLAGQSRSGATPRFAFYIRRPDQLDIEERFFSLPREDMARLNPNTHTCPVFRTRHDAELTLRLYERFPILRNETDGGNSWGVSFFRMFDMANDSNLFLSEPTDASLPLYEAKLLWHYDHRFGSYEFKGVVKGKGGRGLPEVPLACHQDPSYTITPQYWLPRDVVEDRLRGRWAHDWLLCYRTTSSAKLERTLVATILPVAAVNHKAPLILLAEEQSRRSFLFLACFNSLVLDYIARQKVGGTDVGYFHLDQLPFPTPEDFSAQDLEFIRTRVLELVFSANDLRSYARALGWSGGPFQWDPNRRAILRCELDAFFAHFYGLARDEWRFVLDPSDLHGPSFPGETFRVLKEKELSQYGEFVTKRICLQAYDDLSAAAKLGLPYVSRLYPPPFHP